jgi:large subunit ribosomal protein L22
MEAIAKTKYLKGSPRKARLVIDLIRGVNVSRALSILKFTDKRAADPIAQCLNSAIANATYKAEQQNIAIDPDDLWIRTCFVDMGPTKGRRRMRPAPQGRAYREQRHYCHITIEVTSEEKAKTEEQVRLEGLRAERIANRKAAKATEKAKTPAKKATKGSKADEVEKPAVETSPDIPADTTPVETAGTGAVETQAAETANDAADAPIDSSENLSAEGDAEVADAKDVQSQTPAEMHDSKPADEAQLRTNEELERQ